MYTSTVREEEMMTDFQFKTILKMVRNIVDNTDDIEEVRAALTELIDEGNKPEKTVKQKKASS